MGKPQLSVLVLSLTLIFTISNPGFSQTKNQDNFELDAGTLEAPANIPDATDVEINLPRMPEMRELTWFEWYIEGNFNKVVDYFFGDKPDGSANDGKVLLAGLSFLPIGEAFQIGRAGKVAVTAVNEAGISKAAIVNAFKAAGVPKKYISAFKASFKGFLKAEQWDEMSNPVMATAVTNVETANIYARYENLFWTGCDSKAFYNTLLEEAVHSHQIRSGTFLPQFLIRAEARAKIIAYKFFGNWPADRKIVEEQLKLYEKVFAPALANIKK
jgi:hypothetical protein